MKIRKSGVIVTLVLLLAASPYVTGLIVEKKIRFIVDKVSKLSRDSITLKFYRVGWLNTKFTLALKGAKDISVKVYHGPVLLTEQGAQLGLAYIKFNSQSIRKIFQNTIKSISDNSSAQLVINFKRDSVLSINLKALVVYLDPKQSKENKLRLSVSNTDLIIPITKNAQVNGVSGALKEIELKNDGFNVKLQQLVVADQYRRSPKGLTIGDSHWDAYDLRLTHETGRHLSIRKIAYLANAKVKDSAVNFISKITATDAVINKHSIIEIIYRLNLNHLDDRAMTELVSIREKLSKRGRQYRRFMNDLLTRFFSTSPVATAALSVKMNAGVINVTAKYSSRPVFFKGGFFENYDTIVKNTSLTVAASSDEHALSILQEVMSDFNVRFESQQSKAIDPSLASSPENAGSAVTGSTGNDVTASSKVVGDVASTPIPTLPEPVVNQNSIAQAKPTPTPIQNLLERNIILHKGNKYYLNFSYKNGASTLNGNSK